MILRRDQVKIILINKMKGQKNSKIISAILSYEVVPENEMNKYRKVENQTHVHMHAHTQTHNQGNCLFHFAWNVEA